MAPNHSNSDSQIESADTAHLQPCSVTDDITTGDRLVSVSLILPINATIYLLAYLFSLTKDPVLGIILPAVAIMLGLALSIIVKYKFKPIKYPTWPKVCIIANAVCMVFVIIMVFFHFLYPSSSSPFS